MYLGTTEQFVRDYYTGSTDGDEIILVYEYDPKDVISGNPHDSEGEVKVRKAKLTGTIRVAGMASRIAHRFIQRQSATTPLPASFPPEEMGLMTDKEFLKHRNPGNKFHDSGAYNYSLAQMNQDFAIHHAGDLRVWPSREEFDFYRVGNKGYLIKDSDHNLVAIFHNGILYHENKNKNVNSIPTYFHDWRPGRDTVNLDVKDTKVVKYLADYVPLVSDVARENRKTYTTLLQRIKVGDEYLEVRSEGPPGKGNTIAILNEEGLKVAAAQDEWHTTLLTVAQEYRKKGLGKIIGKFWYKANPIYESGGFTPAGQANALKIWNARVREFLSRGWYSELYKQGRITRERINEILAGLDKRTVFKEIPTTPVKKQILVYVDDPAFIIYDSRFLNDPEATDSEKYILGYGFTRESQGVGPYLYRLEYERPYHQMATYIGLQMARDNGEKLYNGQGYSDTLELQGLSNIAQEGDYVWLTKDMYNLKALGKHEKMLRKLNDPYEQTTNLLLEMADAKW